MISIVSDTLKVLSIVMGTSIMFADCSDFNSPEACEEAGCEWIVTVTPNGNQVIEICIDDQDWNDDGGDHEDGPPECLLDCEGIGYVNFEENELTSDPKRYNRTLKLVNLS